MTGLFAEGYGAVDVTAEEMRDFLYFMLSRAGADTMITPREIIRSYMTALGLLAQENGKKRLPDIYKKEDVMPADADKRVNPDDFDPETIEI